MVIVSGSFDDLKSRQIRLLEEAAKLGPLHLHLWSDAAVRTQTGHPPKFPQAERQYLLQAIRFVHSLTLSGETVDLEALPTEMLARLRENIREREIRNPRSEIRNKPEARNPKSEGPTSPNNDAPHSDFGLRNSDFFRISDLGFRISNSSPNWLVDAATDTPAKRAFCRQHGLGYHVLQEADLAGFPSGDENWRSLPESLERGRPVPVDRGWLMADGDGPSPLQSIAPLPTRKKVLVTGCYDWFHSGHVRFFEECAALGDLYVVVGHDANIRLLKGEGHPLFKQEERRYVVGSVRCVKQALISTGHGWLDAEPEIRALKPDIYAVNEDGDKPEKRDFCARNGLEYAVLKRAPAPGLPRRQSTSLRGF